jgi:diguanylate cyclase (GGDEF)-like protein
MHLDLQTLYVVTAFVTALLGALLLFASLQNRSIRAPLWWGAAYIVNAGGLALGASRAASAAPAVVDIAAALVLLGFGLIWAGARVFDGRRVNALAVSLAPLFWLVASRIPAIAGSPDGRVAIVATMLAGLLALAASEIWRGRDEPLLSRWPAVVAPLAYAATLLVAAVAMVLSPSRQDGVEISGLSLALLTFGTLLFTVIMAFLQLNMTKERMELKHKANSQVDPLSGVANRRAFVTGAERLLAQQDGEAEPIAVLLFDLDRLKAINDRHGHAIGDAVLQEFAATAAATLGGDVLLARMGGEEFVCCIPVGDADEAYAIADRVRRNFAAAATRFGDADLMPSVSVGVTLAHDGEAPDGDQKVADLLAVVGRALDRAKQLGRNRVEAELPRDRSAAPGAPSIVPIIDQSRTGMTTRSAGRRRRVIL